MYDPPITSQLILFLLNLLILFMLFVPKTTKIKTSVTEIHGYLKWFKVSAGVEGRQDIENILERD